jgi:hypothetical protein
VNALGLSLLEWCHIGAVNKGFFFQFRQVSGLVSINKRNEPNLAESQQAKYIFLGSCFVLATSRSLFSKHGNFWLFPLKLWQLLHIFSNKILCTLCTRFCLVATVCKFTPKKKNTGSDSKKFDVDYIPRKLAEVQGQCGLEGVPQSPHTTLPEPVTYLYRHIHRKHHNKSSDFSVPSLHFCRTSCRGVQWTRILCYLTTAYESLM